LSLPCGPGWGGALFRRETRPALIRYFPDRARGSKAIDEELWRYDQLTTRQPVAEFARLHVLSACGPIRTFSGS
jgi:hypothetical protein